MQGFEALVAAAAAAKQPGAGMSRQGSGPGMNNVYPNFVQGNVNGGDSPMNATSAALAALLGNPIFMQAVANAQSTVTAYNSPIAFQTGVGVGSGHVNQQGFNLPSGGMQSGNNGTPYQQTRSGRISRPPYVPPQQSFLQSFAGMNPMEGYGATTNGSNIAESSTMANSHSRSAGVSDQMWSNLDVVAEDYDHHSNHKRKRHGGKNKKEGDGGEAGINVEDRASLPAWPLPPSGPGGRRKMGKDEMLARRKERNRAAAVESRKKKKANLAAVKGKTASYDQLAARCQELEKQVHELQRVILSAGLPLPPDGSVIISPESQPPESVLPVADTPFDFSTLANITFPQPPQDMSNIQPNGNGMNTTLAPFDMFSYLDMDGEDDAEFIPPTSPQNDSEEDTDRRNTSGQTRKEKNKGKSKINNKSGLGGEEEDEDEGDEFIDEDVEDEDLFLPIEDVPVPPAAQMESAMRSLGVDNQDDLARLINKMVNAGKEGMTTEMVEKLKVLLALVGPNGTWS